MPLYAKDLRDALENVPDHTIVTINKAIYRDEKGEIRISRWCPQECEYLIPGIEDGQRVDGAFIIGDLSDDAVIFPNISLLQRYIDEIKSHGYDIAIKSWHDDKPTEGYFVIVWQPGNAKESITTTADKINLFHAVMTAREKVLERVNERSESKGTIKE